MATNNASVNAKRALVIEDDIWVEPIIASALKCIAPDLQIDHVESVEEAVVKIKNGNYRVIITDIFFNGMPNGISFWEFCKKACPDSAILLTSSMPLEKLREEFLKGDFDDPLYLRKPLGVLELYQTVQSLFDFTCAQQKP